MLFRSSDFVADLRAPTPTGAAEMAVPNMSDVKTYLNQLNLRLATNISNNIKVKKEMLKKLENSFVLKNPISIYEIKEQKFDNLYERLLISYKNLVNNNSNKMIIINNNLVNSMSHLLNNNTNRYNNLIQKLEALNPILTLKRGYAIVKHDNKAIESIKKIKKDDIINIELQDGNIEAKVL